MIRVHCRDTSPHFSVHEGLLRGNVPVLELDHRRDDSFQVNLDVSHLGFRHFARWLYSGHILKTGQVIDHDEAFWVNEYPRGGSIWDVQELLLARDVGMELECVDFIDTVTDAIIQWLERGVEPNPFVNTLAGEFKPGSGGSQLAIDFLVHGKVPSQRDGCVIYRNSEPLGKLDDPEFTKALAREILLTNGNPFSRELDSQMRRFLARGFLEERKDDGEQSPVRKLRVDNPCKYHRHTEIGLPCYRTKR